MGLRKTDIVVGKRYRMRNHSSGNITVKILRACDLPATSYSRARSHWIALNEKTGREIEIKSASKLEAI